MELCRFTLTPQSPWAGMLRSDTLYGLICWHVAEGEGEAACRALLDAFCANRAPFQLSSAMPAGYLPMPALPSPRRKAFRQLAAEQKKGPEEIGLFNILQKFKKFRKKSWLSLREWESAKNNLSMLALFLGQPEKAQESPKGSKTAFEPHVAIDRRTGAASEGQLFFMRRHYFAPGARLHLYARAEDPEYLGKYLQLIGEVGFGKDAGTGNGRFDLELDRDFKPDSLDVREANASLLLSVCASQAMREVDGYYLPEVKRGKTGPGYGNSFKKPFLMLQEGSVLKKPLAGPFVLQGVNADSRVVQILQPLALPCRLQADEGAQS